MEERFGKTKLVEIQEQKRAWDQDSRPLMDGSLPEKGAFDSATDTIASVVRASETWQTLQIIYNLCIIQKPNFVLELGMNLGISTVYIAAALKALGNGRFIHTVDASPYKVKHAKEMHLRLGLDNVKYTAGLFYDVLDEVLNESPVIDMAFIDGQHEYEPTLKFFTDISQKARVGSLLLFDDVAGYSTEMDAAWSDIKNHDSVHSWAEFGQIGWVVLR